MTTSAEKPGTPPNGPRSRASGGLLLVLAATTAYCSWLAAHWLPLDYSGQELAAIVSRVWDIKRELISNHRLPWWTPNYLCGSSYALNHAQGFYLIPWLLLSTAVDLPTAGKLVALAAILASAAAMFFCARHFLGNEWAAALAALVYALHPQQLTRAGGTEHIGVMLVFPFVPLVWLGFAKALETGTRRHVFGCALAALGLLLTSYKLVLVHGVYLAAFLAFWLWSQRARRTGQRAVRASALIGATALMLGAGVIVPAASELSGSSGIPEADVTHWQELYSFKSPLALVDRDGVVVRHTLEQLQTHLAANQATYDQRDAELFRTVASLGSYESEKYAGIVVLAMILAVALFGRRGGERPLFWFLLAMLVTSVVLAMGGRTLGGATLQVTRALFMLDGVPIGSRVAILLPAGAGVAIFCLLLWREARTIRQRLLFTGAFLAVLALPAFSLLAQLPFFERIRAPYVFYDLPSSFFSALLVGFFVTDVSPRLFRFRSRLATSGLVIAATLLIFIDFWPYQRPLKRTPISETTLASLRETYRALRDDPDRVKTYTFSSRYFHLLGPMLSEKPQAWEAWTSWMAPKGTGMLMDRRWSSGAEHTALMNLIGVRYLIFDKTDPQNARIRAKRAIGFWRQEYPVELENQHFVVLRNDGAWPYIRAFARSCLFVGDPAASPQLSLALTRLGYPLVHRDDRPVGADPLVTAGCIYAAPEAEALSGAAEEGIVQLRDDAPAPLPDLEGEPLDVDVAVLDRSRAETIELRLHVPREAIVVVNESYHPYWRATIDGRPADVLRVSTGLMGFRMHAGVHEVTLRYTLPVWYGAAAAVSLVGALVWLIVVVRDRP